MNRTETLLDIYNKMDTIYTALILIAIWAGIAGHLCGLLSKTKWKVIIPIYWSLILAAYMAGIIFVGLEF